MKSPSERTGCLALVVGYYAVGVVVLGLLLWSREWAGLPALLLFYGGPTWWMLDTRPLRQTRTNVDFVGPEASAAQFSIKPVAEQEELETARLAEWPALRPPVESEPTNAELRDQGEQSGRRRHPQGPSPRWEQPPSSR